MNSLPFNEWLIDNRLSIHLGKAECILFKTKKRLRIISKIKVTCGETNVTAKTSVRQAYLGIDLDQSLDGKLNA